MCLTAFKSIKRAAEIVTVTFDFSALSSSLSSAVVTVERHSGVPDSAPAAMLVGTPQIVAGVVRQRMSGGVPGCKYTLKAQVDAPDGSRWIESALLAVT
jgi:hypothetical protein